MLRIFNLLITYIVFVITIISFHSCKTSDISGQYIICPWNCNTLEIKKDSTYELEIIPEIGNRFIITGVWSRKGRELRLKPHISNNLSFDSTIGKWIIVVDGFPISPNIYFNQVKEITYLIKKKKLVRITDWKYRRCCFYKIDSDSTRNNKLIERNRRNCFK